MKRRTMLTYHRGSSNFYEAQPTFLCRFPVAYFKFNLWLCANVALCVKFEQIPYIK